MSNAALRPVRATEVASNSAAMRTERLTQFAFIRHGMAANVSGRCIGQTDVELTPDGIAQVQEMVDSALLPWFRGLRPPINRQTALLSSDLRRARQTAEIVARELETSVTEDSRLREMSFGEWDGRHWTDIEQSDGARFAHWMRNWQVASSPGGESVDELMARATQFLDGVLNEAATADRAIIVVSHAGWIRAALTCLLRTAISEMFNIEVAHGRAIIVEVRGADAILVQANDTVLKATS